MELKVVDCTVYLRVGREGVLRLGNTDGVMADTHLLYQFDNLAGVETVSHYACPVEVAGYLFYFTFHAIALFVGEGQRFGWFVLDSIYYQIGKVNGSLSSFGKGVVHGKTYLKLFFAMAADSFHLLVRITGKTVECHDDLLAE